MSDNSTAPDFPSDLQLSSDPAVQQLAILLWRAHHHARTELHRAISASSSAELSTVAIEAETDTLFHVDEIAEQVLLDFFDQNQDQAPPFLLVGEFASGESLSFGHGEPQYRILLDPIDGTRLVMHGKASGWILSGIFPEKGERTRLAEAIFALQTEVPLLKHLVAETLWAARGAGAYRRVENLVTHDANIAALHNDPHDNLIHSFISFVNLFPRGKTAIAEVEEAFLNETLKQHNDAGSLIYEDQHLSTGAQLYELIQGKTRLVVDIRPALNHQWRQRREPTVLCAHPYDLCAWLIAHEAGAVVRVPDGQSFDGSASATAEVGWIGFSNRSLYSQHSKTLFKILRQFQLI